MVVFVLIKEGVDGFNLVCMVVSWGCILQFLICLVIEKPASKFLGMMWITSQDVMKYFWRPPLLHQHVLVEDIPEQLKKCVRSCFV